MGQRVLTWGVAAVMAIALAACGSSSNPAAPGGVGAALSGAAAATGDPTLKVSAPGPQSPADGAVLAESPVTLTASAAAGTYVSVALQYRFQVLTTDGHVLADSGLRKGLSYTVPDSVDLKYKTKYQWRVRAEAAGAFGPWSAARTFTTPDILEGYIHSGELLDPLTDGKTVGDVHGSVTYLGSKGIRLNDFTSYISYRLPAPMTSGELSMIITGLETNSPGEKTKVFGMGEGTSDIITNPYRFTVDKRAGGQIFFRIITGDATDFWSTSHNEVYNLGDSKEYLWTLRWGSGFAKLDVRQDNAQGHLIVSKSLHYGGVYRPNPHMVYLGSPLGRSGPVSATVPGMIVRNVWLSTRPRPSFPN